MSYEEEIKLTADSLATLDAVAVDPAVLMGAQGRVMRSRTALATYYDTPDHQLLRHRLAFRMRQRDNGLIIACLKGTGGMVAGLSRRREWELALASPLDRLGDLPEGEMRDRMLAVCSPDTVLTPLLITDFQRRMQVIQVADSRVELALDRGEIRAGGAIHPLNEVELERLEGGLGPIRMFAAHLSQRHALRPSQRSKFGLGLSLLGIQEEV